MKDIVTSALIVAKDNRESVLTTAPINTFGSFQPFIGGGYEYGDDRVMEILEDNLSVRRDVRDSIDLRVKGYVGRVLIDVTDERGFSPYYGVSEYSIY